MPGAPAPLNDAGRPPAEQLGPLPWAPGRKACRQTAAPRLVKGQIQRHVPVAQAAQAGHDHCPQLGLQQAGQVLRRHFDAGQLAVASEAQLQKAQAAQQAFAGIDAAECRFGDGRAVGQPGEQA